MMTQAPRFRRQEWQTTGRSPPNATESSHYWEEYIFLQTTNKHLIRRQK
jgi:hypothetical protein